MTPELQSIQREAKAGSGPHAPSPRSPVGIARAPGADRATTNRFVIRDSARLSNSDRHLAAPSNDSLMAGGFCSVSSEKACRALFVELTTTEIRR